MFKVGHLQMTFGMIERSVETFQTLIDRDMYADRLQATYGSAEIVVEPHPRGWSSFISPAYIRRHDTAAMR